MSFEEQQAQQEMQQLGQALEPARQAGKGIAKKFARKAIQQGTKAVAKAVIKSLIFLVSTLGGPVLLVCFLAVIGLSLIFGYWGSTQNYSGVQQYDNVLQWNVDPVFLSWNDKKPVNKEIGDKYEKYSQNSVKYVDYYHEEEKYKISKGFLIALDKIVYDLKDHAQEHINALKPKFKYKDSTITTVTTTCSMGDKGCECTTTTTVEYIKLLTEADTFAGKFNYTYKWVTYTESSGGSCGTTKTITKEVVADNGIAYTTNQAQPFKDYIQQLADKTKTIGGDDYELIIGMANAIDAYQIEPDTHIIAYLGVNYVTGQFVTVDLYFPYAYSLAFRPLSNTVNPYYDIVLRIAKRYGIDPNLIDAIMFVESSYNPYTKSDAGAAGLMQLMPDTARALGLIVDGNKDERLDPEKSIDAGTRYIIQKINQYHGNVPLALAAYNAGSGNLEKWIRQAGSSDWPALKTVAFKETVAYVDKIIERWNPLPAISGGMFASMPLPNLPAVITCDFGWRVFDGNREFHHGLDLAATPDTTVHAVANGRVIFAGWDGAYGNCIKIDHGNGLITQYAHLQNNSFRVVVGQIVQAGQVLGLAGSTGRSTGVHLHFGVLKDGEYVNPLNFFPSNAFIRG